MYIYTYHKYLSKYVRNFGKHNSGHRTGKDQFSFQSQRQAMPKNVQTTTQLHSFHMLRLDLEKAEKPNQIANIHWIIEKAREFQKKHILLLH